MVYNNGGGTDLGGLTSGRTYYVVAVETEYIQLASAPGGEALALTPDGVTGTRHLLQKLTVELENDCEINPSKSSMVFDTTGRTGQSDQIVFDSDHHFYDGQEVVYNNGVERILNAFYFLLPADDAFFVGTNHGFSDGDAVVYYVDEGDGLEELTS